MQPQRRQPMYWAAAGVFVVGLIEFAVGNTRSGIEGVLLGAVGLAFFEWARRRKPRGPSGD